MERRCSSSSHRRGFVVPMAFVVPSQQTRHPIVPGSFPSHGWSETVLRAVERTRPCCTRPAIGLGRPQTLTISVREDERARCSLLCSNALASPGLDVSGSVNKWPKFNRSWFHGTDVTIPFD
jgi:hypothetical protein